MWNGIFEIARGGVDFDIRPLIVHVSNREKNFVCLLQWPVWNRLTCDEFNFRHVWIILEIRLIISKYPASGFTRNILMHPADLVDDSRLLSSTIYGYFFFISSHNLWYLAVIGYPVIVFDIGSAFLLSDYQIIILWDVRLLFLKACHYIWYPDLSSGSLHYSAQHISAHVLHYVKLISGFILFMLC